MENIKVKTYIVAFLTSIYMALIAYINNGNILVILFMSLGFFISILISNKENL